MSEMIQQGRDLNDLTRSVLYEEVPNQDLMRLTAIVIGSAFLLFLLWGSIAKIHEMAREQGEIIPSGYAQVVQHLEGGIVSEILVNEGDLVEEGEVLLRMGGSGAMEDFAAMRERQTALQLQAERLRALANGETPDFDKVADGDADAVNYQKQLLASSQDAYASERKVLENQLAQRQQAVSRLNAQYQAAQKELEGASELLVIRQKLASRGSVARKDVIEGERDVARLQGLVGELEAQREEARQGVDEYLNRLQTLGAKTRDQTLQELEEVNIQIAQNKEMLDKLSGRVDRMAVRAPVRGLVKGIQVNTVGGVIQPGAPILEIVPLDRTLIVEVRIAPRDIGNMRTGQPARVKVSAFDFSRYGVIEGTLTFLSATTFIDEEGNSYYKGRITLDQNYVGLDPKRNLILPGMTVEADIITGEKTVLAYLLKPINIAMTSAFHEK